jgi:hypothetical protein
MADNTFTIETALKVQGNTQLVGAITAANTLSVNGNLTATKDLGVTGNATFSNAVTFAGTLSQLDG